MDFKMLFRQKMNGLHQMPCGPMVQRKLRTHDKKKMETGVDSFVTEQYRQSATNSIKI